MTIAVLLVTIGLILITVLALVYGSAFIFGYVDERWDLTGRDESLQDKLIDYGAEMARRHQAKKLKRKRVKEWERVRGGK